MGPLRGEGRLAAGTAVARRTRRRSSAGYRSDLQRLRSQRDLAEDVAWLKELPVKVLVERDVLPAQPTDKASRVEQMLSFFGVASVEAWSDVYAAMACAFRQTKAYEAKPGAVATWLRLGEIAAHDVHCQPFDRAALEAALPALRALTCERPEVFGPKMRNICAAHGVAVLFVEEFPGARASGVTRWLTPSKAPIQLSLRYRTDDHLWFTFFHEVAHVLRELLSRPVDQDLLCGFRLSRLAVVTGLDELSVDESGSGTALAWLKLVRTCGAIATGFADGRSRRPGETMAQFACSLPVGE